MSKIVDWEYYSSHYANIGDAIAFARLEERAEREVRAVIGQIAS